MGFSPSANAVEALILWDSESAADGTPSNSPSDSALALEAHLTNAGMTTSLSDGHWTVFDGTFSN